MPRTATTRRADCDAPLELLRRRALAAMARRGEALLRVTPTGWGAVATGGFPPALGKS